MGIRFWPYIANLVLQQKVVVLLVLGVLTAWFAYIAPKNEIRYDFAKLLPEDDSVFVDYMQFRKTFGEDGNILALGVTDSNFFAINHFQHWLDLNERLKKIEGCKGVLSITGIYNLRRNDSLKKFELSPIINQRPQTQAEIDSLKGALLSVPFYDDVLYNKGKNSYLLAVTIDQKVLDNKVRNDFVSAVQQAGEAYQQQTGVQVRYSGLPYIRTVMSVLIQKELRIFMLISALISACILYYFFRSYRIVVFSLVVVLVGVIWAMGFNVLLGYKISALTALVPTLLIVLGIPNCVFIVNKYHFEFKSNRNKAKVLALVVEKVGTASFLTNATTAAGFVTFAFTQSQVIKEFGILSTLSVMALFLLSITLTPIFLFLAKEPTEKELEHLDRKGMDWLLKLIHDSVHQKRTTIYLASIILMGIGAFLMTGIKTTGNIVDDLPTHHTVVEDLHWFEDCFNGVMPFEISIDTKTKRGVMSRKVLLKLEALQEELLKYPEFARPISITEVLKFARQAFYYGDSSMYSMPSSQEQLFILNYVKVEKGKENLMKNFLDSTKSITRVSAHIRDVGTKDLHRIKTKLRPFLDSLFNPEKYKVTLTGTSLVFLRGTETLIDDLIYSTILALILTAGLMAGLFSSPQMILVCLVPNILPLVITAALMSVLNIALKPSTILIFSIAFGIAVDNTIHFLAKYRNELKIHRYNIKASVNAAIKESSIGIIYTSVILFFGFGVFSFSTFGGTQSMGILISITLLSAMFCNLFLVPALLLSIDKKTTKEAMENPMVDLKED